MVVDEPIFRCMFCLHVLSIAIAVARQSRTAELFNFPHINVLTQQRQNDEKNAKKKHILFHQS